MKVISRLMILGAVFFLFAAPGCSDQPLSQKVQALTDVDTAGLITLTEAIEIALAELEGGFAIEAELELDEEEENEPLHYEVEVYLHDESKIMEVKVDAQTGQVLEVEVEVEEEDEDEDEDFE